jgi:predicted amidophosphoribosyltransferase
MALRQRVKRVVVCPCCAKALQWSSSHSGRARCPHCRNHLVLLVHRDGACKVLPESGESLDEMITDWLIVESEEDYEEKSEFERLRAPAEATADAQPVL